MTSYRDAGVDLEGAESHTRNIAGAVTRSWRDSVIGGFGGFAAGVRIPAGYDDPVVMMTADGVGTKLEIARQSGLWAGVGHDLVAMCVDDLAAAGAQPIGMVDYLAVGKLNPERDLAVVESIAEACTLAETPLLGGETAEHPGVMGPDAIDIAGAAMGVIDGPTASASNEPRAGDVIIGLASPNLRSNGFSLVRNVLEADVIRHAETLLAPSVIYSPTVWPVVQKGVVRAAAHITGGGLKGNLSRVLPAGLGAEIDLSAWERPEVFDLVAGYGVPEDEMQNTFNLGIGFCLVVEPEAAEHVKTETSPHSPRIIGAVTTESGVRLN